MSSLHLGQIRTYLTETFLSDVDVTGTADDSHRLSRAVTAMALHERAAVSPATAAKSVTDHPRDGGIDGIAYAADRFTLVMVQSKWTDTDGGVSLADVLKFLEGVKNLVNNSWETFGGPIESRRAEIEDILFQPGTRIEMVLATTSSAELASPQQNALAALCKEMNDASEIASSVYLNQQRLYAAVTASIDAQIDLDVNLRNWGSYHEGGHTSYYGTASAQEVVAWHAKHGDLLFSKNIRGALKGTDVNDAIVATASQDPSRFWFFNNGITVIAESFEKTPHVNQKSGNFHFERASVVNGAQTVSSLSRAAAENPDLLESADVFVRFVTVDDPDGEFSRLVTRRTNTQNRVGGREFVALDPEQERLRMEFAVSGLRYAYRSGETVTDPAKGCDLTDATVALACTCSVNEVVLAKREISRLWEDTSKAPYKTLFNASISGPTVWTAVKVLRLIDRSLESARSTLDGRDRLIAVHGNRIIAWAVMRRLGVHEPSGESGFTDIYQNGAIDALTTAAATNLVSIVGERYPDAYPQPLFKNQTKCRDLGDRLLASLASVDSAEGSPVSPKS